MSIASAIQNAQQKVANAYTAVDNKGGTLPATQDLSNLPNAINTISTGGTINSLNVTPSTSAQTITASGGVDGFNPVNVSAVTSSIDPNIVSGNIVTGKSILGVAGSATVLNGETRTVSLTNSAGQTFTPTSGKNAITSITVNPSNLARTVTPTTSSQSIGVQSGFSGNGTITVNAVTSAIDQNIQPENIKKDIVILGTTGTYEGASANIDSLSITPTTSAQTITASGGVDGYSPINVSAVTSAIDSNIQPQFIRNGIDILGVIGTYGDPIVMSIKVSNSVSGYLLSTGDFYLCGDNTSGQQGDGTTTNVTTFTKRAENAASIYMSPNSYDTAYITKTGDLYLTGKNDYGQQGDGTTTNVIVFTKVAENVAQAYLSDFTSGYLTTSGDFYLCGDNTYGQQSNGSSGTNQKVTTFTKVAENVAQISLSRYSSGYLTTTGDFYLCGQNSYGQQGNGTSGSTTHVKTFTKRAENVAKIFLTNSTSGYLTTSGDFYLCGWNNRGHQGDGTTTNVKTFTKRAENVTQIYLEDAISGYLTTTGDFYLCGINNYGQQGNGTSGSGTDVKTFTKRAENVASIYMSNSSATTAYLTTSGDFYLCGENNYGQQGNGSSGTNQVVKTFTKRAENVAKISLSENTSSYSTTSDEIYLCGNGVRGQQGSGDTTNVTTFTKRN